MTIAMGALCVAIMLYLLPLPRDWDVLANLVRLVGFAGLGAHALTAMGRYEPTTGRALTASGCVVLVATYAASDFAMARPSGGAPLDAIGWHWLTLTTFDTGANVLMLVCVLCGLADAGRQERNVLRLWLIAATLGILAGVIRLHEIVSPADGFADSVPLNAWSILIGTSGVVLNEVNKRREPITHERIEPDGMGRETTLR